MVSEMLVLATSTDANEDQILDENLEAARKFYCDVLNGRQIAVGRRGDVAGRLWFTVGGALFETGYRRRRQPARALLRVEDPAEVAARCWNAGYTVIADDRDDTSPTALTVVDPFGLRVELVPR